MIFHTIAFPCGKSSRYSSIQTPTQSRHCKEPPILSQKLTRRNHTAFSRKSQDGNLQKRPAGKVRNRLQPIPFPYWNSKAVMECGGSA